MFDLLAILITLSAIFSYVNHRFIGLPTTIGVMLISLVVSLGIIAANAVGIGDIHALAHSIIAPIDFNYVLMQVMLSLLLFAGAMQGGVQESHGSEPRLLNFTVILRVAVYTSVTPSKASHPDQTACVAGRGCHTPPGARAHSTTSLAHRENPGTTIQ